MSRVCPTCATQNEETATYCDYCGNLLPQPASPRAPVNRPAPLPPQPPPARPSSRGPVLTCGNCGQEVPAGDIFCSNCGTPAAIAGGARPAATPYLSSSTPIPPPTLSPAPAPTPETAFVGDKAPNLQPVPSAATQILSRGRLVIGSAEIQLPLQTELTLGRQDPYSKPPWHPDVDLTPYGAGDPAYGVSRRHARLVWSGEWTIEDSESANGTFVAGQQIKERTPLSNGDQITLGRLVLTFLAS